MKCRFVWQRDFFHAEIHIPLDDQSRFVVEIAIPYSICSVSMVTDITV